MELSSCALQFFYILNLVLVINLCQNTIFLWFQLIADSSILFDILIKSNYKISTMKIISQSSWIMIPIMNTVKALSVTHFKIPSKRLSENFRFMDTTTYKKYEN